MRCIVTGGSGFIGSHLVETLLGDGWDVTVLDLRPPVADVEWLNVDIRNDLGDRLKGFDYVFHLAAVANARKCSESPVLCYETNVVGTLNLLQAARKAEIQRFVLASSAWLAGAQLGDFVTEESPFEIRYVNTLYGASKLAQESLCISFKSEYGGPDYTILRYGTPYGERMWKGLVVRAFMEMAENHHQITIMGDGKQFREFLYVGDLATAHAALGNPVSANQVYNLTGKHPISVEKIAQEILKYFSATIEYIPQARIEPKLVRVDSLKANTQLAWSPKVDFEVGISQCVEWWNNLSTEMRRLDYWSG